jgi:hypothetical protein
MTMRVRCSPVWICVATVLAAPAAYAQNSACQTVQFSSAVLERFPGVREGCIDVIDRDGQKYAVFKADLVRTAPSSITVRFKRPDGSHGASRNLKLDPARRVLVEGEPVRVTDLAVGQELTAYVKVTEPMIALAPVANEPLQLEPLEPEAPLVASAVNASMPETAGLMPTFGLAGLLLTFGGGVLTLLRASRNRRAS